MSPSPLDFLHHIQNECGYILRVTAGKNRDEVIGDETVCKAVVRSLEIIGEAIKNYPMIFVYSISKYNGKIGLVCGIY